MQTWDEIQDIFFNDTVMVQESAKVVISGIKVSLFLTALASVDTRSMEGQSCDVV